MSGNIISPSRLFTMWVSLDSWLKLSCFILARMLLWLVQWTVTNSIDKWHFFPYWSLFIGSSDLIELQRDDHSMDCLTARNVLPLWIFSLTISLWLSSVFLLWVSRISITHPSILPFGYVDYLLKTLIILFKKKNLFPFSERFPLVHFPNFLMRTYESPLSLPNWCFFQSVLSWPHRCNTFQSKAINFIGFLKFAYDLHIGFVSLAFLCSSVFVFVSAFYAGGILQMSDDLWLSVSIYSKALKIELNALCARGVSQ